MCNLIKRFAINEDGAATAEYGLIAVGLSLAILTVLQGIGLRLSANYFSIQTSAR